MTPPTGTTVAANRSIDHVIVVVPAHDEAEYIEATLDHLISAAARLPSAVTHEIVVVADGCTDRTASLATRPSVTVIESAPRCVGLARRLGTEHALAGSTGDPDRIWLASTDADTIVPHRWLTRQLDLARSGVVAVAGIVEIGGSDQYPDLAARYDRYYELHADGTHTHVHGANLGVRADAYLAAGGWSPLHTGEDHDLWNRLVPFGRTRSTTELRVRTSCRLEGRAPDGFAADLNRLMAAS